MYGVPATQVKVERIFSDFPLSQWETDLTGKSHYMYQISSYINILVRTKSYYTVLLKVRIRDKISLGRSRKYQDQRI